MNNVPVNGSNLFNPRTDMMKIAFAGPASNLFLALIGGIILHLKQKIGFAQKDMELLLNIDGRKFLYSLILLLKKFLGVATECKLRQIKVLFLLTICVSHLGLLYLNYTPL